MTPKMTALSKAIQPIQGKKMFLSLCRIPCQSNAVTKYADHETRDTLTRSFHMEYRLPDISHRDTLSITLMALRALTIALKVVMSRLMWQAKGRLRPRKRFPWLKLFWIQGCFRRMHRAFSWGKLNLFQPRKARTVNTKQLESICDV